MRKWVPGGATGCAEKLYCPNTWAYAESWVLMRDVKGDDRLGNEFIPQVHWECRISSGQTGYEIVFEGAYGTFCGVGPVYAWGYQLILDIFCIHISLQRNGGAFVVHSLKFGT
jgi:hypothetical protein